MGKSAVMVISKDRVEGRWKWGEHELPKVSSYCYLGIDFASNGAWDVHINEAVRGDMGLESLRGRRDRAKLKWWYKLVSMPEDRYPKQLFSREWETKPRRGR